MLITTSSREKEGRAVVTQENDSVILHFQETNGVHQKEKFNLDDSLFALISALRKVLIDNTFIIRMSRESDDKASKRLWKTQLRIKDGKVILADNTINFREDDPENAAQIVVQEKYTLAIFLWLLKGLTTQNNIDSVELVIED